jgi:serine/threonine-protein kinase
MTTSVADFLTTLRDSRLLEPARLEEISRTPEAKEVDAPTLGLCLIQLGWLTEYQVGELLQGRTSQLVLGPYRLEDRLGNGGRGAVAYRARHPEKDGRLALKVVPKERLGDPAAAQRLAQETRAAAQLAHPSIARVSDVESLGDQHIYVREFVEGIDLAQLVREHGPLPATYACDYIHQAAQALQQAHERGLAHGHIQASNLIIVQGPSPIGAAAAGAANGSTGLPAPGSALKIVDFGLGALHEEGVPSAFVPADPARVRRDLNDLGRTFAFLLCGEAAALPGAEVPRPVQDVLQKLRNEGYRSAADVVNALAPLCGSTEPTAEYPTVPMAAPLAEEVPPPPAPLPAEAPPAPAAGIVWESPGDDIPMAAEVASDVAVATAPPIAEPHLEVAPASAALAAPVSAPAEAFQASAPSPAFAPDTATDEQPAPLMAGAVAEEEQAAVELAPRRKRKYGPRFWVMAALGLLLHLVAAGIFIYFIISMMSPSEPPRHLPPANSTNKGAPPKIKKGPPKAELKPQRVTVLIPAA